MVLASVDCAETGRGGRLNSSRGRQGCPGALPGQQRFAHPDRVHHQVGRAPKLLVGLQGDRLLALLLERISGGAAVEEPAAINGGVEVPDHVVVDAVVPDDVAGDAGNVGHLGGRALGVAADQAAQAGAGGVGGD